MRKLTFFCIATLISLSAFAKEIPIFVYFSESHRGLFEDWFEPTLPDEFDLHVFHIEQMCPTGDFMEEGWKEAMRKKVELTLEMIDRYWGEVFVYSDVDIQFFRPVSEELTFLMKYHDFLIQRSSPKGKCCAGFFVARANQATKNLFKKTLKLMDKESIKEDETALNIVLENAKELKWAHLPITYYCGGTLTGVRWNLGDDLPIPENIALHHANWTVGIDNKISQFELVRSKVSQNDERSNFLKILSGWN